MIDYLKNCNPGPLTCKCKNKLSQLDSKNASKKSTGKKTYFLNQTFYCILTYIVCMNLLFYYKEGHVFLYVYLLH